VETVEEVLRLCREQYADFNARDFFECLLPVVPNHHALLFEKVHQAFVEICLEAHAFSPEEVSSALPTVV
jgi:hypothetical protein